ncbi:DUF1476 domain-containing protein [Lichenifustis flavocetrariae]|uniref:DUF1476 domain-containing protein n=1 Tax=Lichenifustis flavocetrariae TaxID=2949735 RepID=A0AA41YUR7_9HYPH|nr:DUF1476 domain-containing protein [Lichenifustis flavocetrariae]MCW6507258.1 DUF1476 domain-containing protein [Lichenifustis flavocetrariae]
MTTFDEREHAFENLYVHDQDVRFRVLARRNKALADWAAALVGKTGADAAAYRDDVLAYALSHDGDEMLAQKILEDLRNGQKIVALPDIRAQMDKFMAAALQHEKEG